MHGPDDLRPILDACRQNCSGRFQLWERILSNLQPQTALEVGVWEGDFAAYILKKCPSIGTYWMLDAWRRLPEWNKPTNVDDDKFAQVYARAMEQTRFAESRVKVLRGTTVEMIDEIPDDSLDFVYIDGDHTLRGIAIDLINVWRKVKPGGYFGGDDLDENIWLQPKQYEPTLVFPFAVYFSEAMRAPIYALPFAQFLISKPMTSNRRHVFVDLVGSYGNQSVRNQVARPWRIIVRNVARQMATPGGRRRVVQNCMNAPVRMLRRKRL
jgi:hypothetical protein